MTKKDFVAIAAAIAQMDTTTANRSLAAGLLASVFAATYPRFDRDRFLAACRYSSVAVKHAANQQKHGQDGQSA